jgi:hypothetical protein
VEWLIALGCKDLIVQNTVTEKANAVNTIVDLWVTIDDEEMARWGV